MTLRSPTLRRQRQRKPLDHVVRRYDRVAPLYSTLEPLFGILPLARRKAVAALGVARGASVLEIGAGSGRNLPDIENAIGPTGRVVAVDASPGMLAQAGKLINRRGWSNVELIEQDAALLDVAGRIDAVLFSLSYSVIPDPKPVLARAWELLATGGRLVIMDAGITESRLQPVLAPLTRFLLELGPGDPYSTPWVDLAELAPVNVERFLFNLYFVCSITKPAEG